MALLVRGLVLLGHADEGEGAVVARVAHHEGDDPREVALHRQHHHVDHVPDLVGERVAVGRRIGGADRPAVLELKAGLQLPDGGQVLVHLPLIGAAELGLQGRGVLFDEVEDALLEELRHLVQLYLARAADSQG